MLLFLLFLLLFMAEFSVNKIRGEDDLGGVPRGKPASAKLPLHTFEAIDYTLLNYSPFRNA